MLVKQLVGERNHLHVELLPAIALVAAKQQNRGPSGIEANRIRIVPKRSSFMFA
ncbi:MAG TPA: hypothetical protein VFD88_06445 [Clostridia bacterium]|nr:hypothetical protein [Clostridia bacterium]